MFFRSFFLFVALGLGNMTSAHESSLHGSIRAVSEKGATDSSQLPKILPGDHVILSINVHNEGSAPSEPGTLYIRYSMIQPLSDEKGSVLFCSEEVPLPSIAPGDSKEFAFERLHKWPTLPDYIREGWSYREYQAVAKIDGKEKPIGSLAITYSAYYYPAVSK